MRIVSVSLALATLCLTACEHDGKELIAQAKIGRPAAEQTALSHVPGGRIKEGELEKEDGRIVWSFDIAQPDSKNIIEVQVDAIDGTVVSQQTETPEDEAKEAAEEKEAKSSGKP